MPSTTEIQHRLMRPIDGLLAAWEPKAAAAAGLALVLQFLDHVAGLYGQLFDTDPLLVTAIATLLMLDLVSGIAAAAKRQEPIGSKGLRQTGYKIVEYTLLGGAGVLLANAFAVNPLHYITDGLDDAVLLFIALTEAFSIVENITGSRAGAQHLVRKILRVWRTDRGGVAIEEAIERFDPDRTENPGPERPQHPGAEAPGHEEGI